MHFVDAKGLLTGSGGHYGMNIYRGCSHGCIYCDSRSLCYRFTHPFEDIEVKRNAPGLLEQALRAKRRRAPVPPQIVAGLQFGERAVGARRTHAPHRRAFGRQTALHAAQRREVDESHLLGLHRNRRQENEKNQRFVFHLTVPEDWLGGLIKVISRS